MDRIALNPVLLFGAGELCLEICSYISDINSNLPVAKQIKVVGVHDIADKTRLDDISEVLNYTPQLFENLDDCLTIDDTHWVIAVGSPALRAKVKKILELRKARISTIIHPSAYISKTAKVGVGSIVAPKVFVGPKAKVGENTLINVGAVIGHDAKIGHSSVISPLANMNGQTEIGCRSLLGAGSTMNPGTKMGSDSKLTAGSVLSNSVEKGFLMHGNPAKGRRMFNSLEAE